MGLVHEICEPGALDEAAEAVVDHLLLAAPDAVAATKRAVRECAGAVVDDATFERLVDEHAARRRTAEAAEGLASFVERRKPAWYP